MPSVAGLANRMRDMSENSSLPSNVSDMLEDAADKLEDTDKELSVRINTAGSILDEISNDPNIKQHTRTRIWNLASKVEELEED